MKIWACLRIRHCLCLYLASRRAIMMSRKSFGVTARMSHSSVFSTNSSQAWRMVVECEGSGAKVQEFPK